MKLPRFIHRVWAWFYGYFWLPCPACGEYFGGHEEVRGAGIYSGRTETARLVCPSPDCQAYARMQSIEYWIEISRREGRAAYRRQCQGKVRHGSKFAAGIAISREPNPFGLNSYKCEHCGGWHVGHNYADRRALLNELRDRCKPLVVKEARL